MATLRPLWCKAPGPMHLKRRFRQCWHTYIKCRETCFFLFFSHCQLTIAALNVAQAMIDQGKPYVYRFRVPFDREIVVDDLVLGEAWCC